MIVQRKRDALALCRTEISRFEVGILENLAFIGRGHPLDIRYGIERRFPIHLRYLEVD